MFDYSIKTKVISISILVVLIIALIFLVNNNNSRSHDFAMVSQSRDLATGLEKYFDKNNAYPEILKTNLANIQVITENGLNQEGEYIYFSSVAWSKNGTLASSKERYIIDFEMDKSWDLWNLNGGGICRISNYLKMECMSR